MVWMYHNHDVAMCKTYIECPNLEIRKTRNDFSVQVRNFLLPLSLKVFRHKEREAQSFYSAPPHLVRHLPKASASKRKSTLLVSTLLTFFKFPKSSARFRCVTSPALGNPVSYLGYCDISEWHVRCPRARVWTPVLMLHLSNPCTVPKGSQPN